MFSVAVLRSVVASFHFHHGDPRRQFLQKRHGSAVRRLAARVARPYGVAVGKPAARRRGEIGRDRAGLDLPARSRFSGARRGSTKREDGESSENHESSHSVCRHLLSPPVGLFCPLGLGFLHASVLLLYVAPPAPSGLRRRLERSHGGGRRRSARRRTGLKFAAGREQRRRTRKRPLAAVARAFRNHHRRRKPTTDTRIVNIRIGIFILRHQLIGGLKEHIPPRRADTDSSSHRTMNRRVPPRYPVRRKSGTRFHRGTRKYCSRIPDGHHMRR